MTANPLETTEAFRLPTFDAPDIDGLEPTASAAPTPAYIPAAPPRVYTPTRDRAALSTALVGLVFALGLLFARPAPVAARVVQLVGVPAPGWYEADDLAAAAEAAGGVAPKLASAPVEDGDTVRLVGGFAIPQRAPAAMTARVFGQRTSLNGATREELEALPGIGPTLAARIVAGRPYRAVADLDRVKGIGPKKLAALRPLVAP